MQVRNDTPLQPQKPANKMCGAHATLPNSPYYQYKGNTGSRQVPLSAALRLCFHREFILGILRNLSLQFPYQVFRSALFPASPPPGCSQCGVLFSCLPSHPFLLPGRIFFFSKAHSGACLFFLKLYRDLLASFAAGHPVFKVPVLLKTIISGCLCIWLLFLIILSP